MPHQPRQKEWCRYPTRPPVPVKPVPKRPVPIRPAPVQHPRYVGDTSLAERKWLFGWQVLFYCILPPVGPAFLDGIEENGDPGGTRTPYLQIRNLSLYPDELRDHKSVMP